MTISGESYGKYLIELRRLATGTGAKIEHDDLLKEYENENVQKVLAQTPAASVEETAIKSQSFVKELLVSYEAAMLSSNPLLADYFLGAWVRGVQIDFRPLETEEIFTKFFDPNLRSRITLSSDKLVNIQQKIEEILKRDIWPAFVDQAKFKERVEARSIDILVHELVNCKFPVEGMPAFANRLMGALEPSRKEAYVIDKYAGELKEAKFAQIDTMTDPQLALYLERFKKLETLDLTNGVKLTQRSVAMGHPTLKKIVITNTSLDRSDFPKERFPNLTEIIQDKKLNIFVVDENILRDTPWATLQQNFRGCDYIRDNGRFDMIRTLLTRFQQNPCMPGLEALFTLRDHYKKDEGFSIAASACEKEIYKTLFQCWGSLDDLNSGFGLAVTTLLLRRAVVKLEPHVEINQAIWNVLCKESRKKVDHHTETEYLEYTESDVTRARSLFQFMTTQGYNVAPAQLDNSLAFSHFDRRMFFAQADNPSLVRTFKLTAELHTAMSNVVEHSEENYHYTELKDPAKEQRYTQSFHSHRASLVGAIFEGLSRTYHEAGPMYRAVRDYVLACGFVHKAQNRRKFYENLLKEFKEYRSVNTHYSLAKMVLGTLTPLDIPVEDNNNLLKDQFLAYRGFLSEDFDEDFKVQIFTDLVSGHLGGITCNLVDGLVALYGREGLSEAWKGRILQSLTKIGGILYKGPVSGFNYFNPLTNNAVKAYARAAIQRLANAPREHIGEDIPEAEEPAVPAAAAVAMPERPVSENVD